MILYLAGGEMPSIGVDQDAPVVRDDVTIRRVMSVINHRYGCVVVVDEGGRATGTIDDRCILDGLLFGHKLDSPAAQLQRPIELALSPDAHRADVLDVMEARGLPLVPIVDGEGRLVGVHLRDRLIGPPALDNWAVIMAGGSARRLAPSTDAIPKSMLPVAGRPILERLVLHLVGAGIRTIFLAVCHGREQVEGHFGNGSKFGCSINYLIEDIEKPLGSGGLLGLLAAQHLFPNRPLLVLDGDHVVDFSVTGILKAHQRSVVAATMAVHPYRYQVPYGVVRTENDCLVGLVEKPVTSWLVNAGIYVLEPGILRNVPSGQCYSINSLLEDCRARGNRVRLWEIDR